MIKCNRREWLLACGAGSALAARAAFAAAPSYAGEYPDMLLAYLAGKLNVLAAKWDAERDRITTAAQVEERNRFVREKVREMVHGFPERCPLAPVTVAAHERSGYRVENVIFQSQPDFWVTGNLYVPAGRPPFPGIISPCGHYPVARMEPEYQCAYINLALSGFAVLAYDPVGQGERRQYWDPRTGATESGLGPIFEHSMPGQLLLLMGEDLTHYRIWDGMRAIDYLLTRPEVDPARIGCAGHSGGGTLTLFLSVVDERIKCSVVNEGGTNHRWPMRLQTESRVGPSDVEQNLFPAALYGADLCDLHAAIAPRPLLALIENYAPPFLRAADHIRKRYAQLGVPEKFGTEEATDPHSWTPKLRIATTNWFSRWFYNRPGPSREPEFETEKPETLYCTPRGSIREAGKGQTIFTLIRAKGERLPPSRPVPADAAGVAAFRREMAGEIARLLRLGTESSYGGLGVRPLVTTPRKGYTVEKLEFLSEPGIYIPAWVFVPERVDRARSAIVWVNEAGKEADGMEFGVLERFARQGHVAVAVDVRGVGGTRPPHTSPDYGAGPFNHLFSVETAASYMAWFMDESLFGMRVRDVRRAVDYALSRTDVDRSGVRMVGKGAGALWSLYAAALDERIRSLVAEGGLVTYAGLTQGDRYLEGAGIFVRDVLLRFDLPHVAGAVADRNLVLVAPVDPMKRALDRAAAANAYQWALETYRHAGAADRFRIAGRGANADPAEAYLALL